MDILVNPIIMKIINHRKCFSLSCVSLAQKVNFGEPDNMKLMKSVKFSEILEDRVFIVIS